MSMCRVASWKSTFAERLDNNIKTNKQTNKTKTPGTVRVNFGRSTYVYFSHHLELSTQLFEDLAFCKSFSSNFLLLLRPNQVCSQNLHVKFPSPYLWGFHQHQTYRILLFFLVPMDFSILFGEFK